MEGEQNNLRPYIEDFFRDLQLYDDYKNGHHYKDLLEGSIILFLEKENTYTAYEIYENFFMIYQITDEDKSHGHKTESIDISESNSLLKLVNVMKDYEENTGDLIEKQRDHFIHSVNVFILGLAIYASNHKYRNAFEAYVTDSPYKKYYKTADGEFSAEEFLYRWGIASLFHDIGYPVEIIGKQLSKFINDSSQSISQKYKVNTAVNFKNFNELNSIIKLDPKFPIIYRMDYPETNFIDVYKPTNLMAHQIFTDLYVDSDIRAIDEFDELNEYLYKLVVHLDGFVDYMTSNNFIDHGFFSSIFVLNSYGAIMQKHYLNDDEEKFDYYINKYAYFFYPVLNSATSILLHNYFRGTLNEKESKTDEFNLGKLEPMQNPLAFLLIFCDELQEWNRRPIGLKDKAKNHVHDIKININENQVLVDYIVKNSALGLNFSENKEELINNLLDVTSIFSNGLKVNITPYLDEKYPLEDISLSEVETPRILLRHVEEIARASHNRYNEIGKAHGNPDEPYESLSPKRKLSSIRQTKEFPMKLNLIGCEMVSENDPRDEYSLSDDELDFLAEREHEAWCREKRNVGYISHHDAFKRGLIDDAEYDRLCRTNEEGCETNKHNKIESPERNLYVHSNIIPYDELNQYSKNKDRRPFEDLPDNLKLIKNNPLKIVENRYKLFTVAMHNEYMDYIAGKKEVPEFKDLPFELQQINYKQTYLIAKYLNEIGYEIVEKDDERPAVTKFENNKETGYLAGREHNAWYLRKLNDGCTNGKNKDGTDNPRINPWDELDYSLKKPNMNTFKKLPKLCLKADLKIIKNK
ncbi:hypothetical protein mru_1287 [Methanobrevibacter ruminantium M1]|uniref:Uncharacterized protein n=1 Tax=Methanobrevibacter ruminantium (strain ATCC 35063 / DSM 1093 / JCM 13430 / OCM 146 / M1) TaxID=634498 RepID=D3E3M6_METRM|nr:hypothetical protein [Methanobrevibacter ruminantium]ADC47137.1 hypothetical protein mru_1287 [Methanobrevibacter ruminantium M1]